MKIALLRFHFGWLMGLVDDEEAKLAVKWDSKEDDPPVTIQLRYPAEPQPTVQAIPGKVDGSIMMTGQVFPVWLQVPRLRVNVETAVAGDVFDVPSPEDILSGVAAISPPLIRAYVNSLGSAGISIQESGNTRVRLPR